MLTLRAGRERCDLGGPGLGPLMLLLQLSCRMQLCPCQGGAANQLSVPCWDSVSAPDRSLGCSCSSPARLEVLRDMLCPTDEVPWSFDTVTLYLRIVPTSVFQDLVLVVDNDAGPVSSSNRTLSLVSELLVSNRYRHPFVMSDSVILTKKGVQLFGVPACVCSPLC